MVPAMARQPALAALALALLLLPASGKQLAKTSHPVSDVIKMLKDLGDTADKEHKAEEVSYTKFVHWCTTNKKELKKVIASGKEKKAVLGDKIESHKKAISVLDEEMQALDDERGNLTAAGADSDSKRNTGAKLFATESASLQATIEAINTAIDALTKTKDETDGFLQTKKQAEVVLAMVGSSISSEKRTVLEDWADGFDADEPRPELKAEGDYTEHVDKYSFKSSSVIELLKELQAKFKDQKTEAIKAETNAQHAHAMEQDARAELISRNEESKKVKEQAHTTRNEDLAEDSMEFQDVSADFEADTDSLKSTEQQCRTKDEEWNTRTETRKNEKVALEKAKEILSKATGVRTEAPGNPVPPPSPIFLQVSNPKTQEALNLVRKQAKLMKSKALEHLAELISSRGDEGPFDVVVNSIQKMVFRLKQEQKDEDDHKHWCDQEISTADQSKEAKMEKHRELQMKRDKHQYMAMELASDTQDALEMIDKINQHQQEATEIRNIGKKENEAAMADADTAQSAVANAIAVITDFYKSSGRIAPDGSALVQTRSGDPFPLSETPETWGSEYTGVAKPGEQPEGIISVLEGVSSNFVNMRVQTESQEAADQDKYEQSMKEHEIEKARRVKEAEMKKQERGRVLDKHGQISKTLKTTEEELNAAVQYRHELKEPCETGESSYEDRKAARQDEIAALGQAQKLLQSAFDEKPAFMLRGSTVIRHAF